MNNKIYQTNCNRTYERQLNITLPLGYVVHHIDFNHKNSIPGNLIALTRQNHIDLHTKLRRLVKKFLPTMNSERAYRIGYIDYNFIDKIYVIRDYDEYLRAKINILTLSIELFNKSWG